MNNWLLRFSFKKIMVVYTMLVGGYIISEVNSCVPKSELGNPLAWLAISSYDTAVLYSIFFSMKEDPNDRTVKIETLKQELIDNGIPFATLAYAVISYSKQVNEVLSFFNDADKPTRLLIVGFVNMSYNSGKVYRVLGGIVGVLCLSAIINKLLSIV